MSAPAARQSAARARAVELRPGACADVCLVLEGTYPYVSGGVSVWVHDLIRAQSHLKFHLTVLVPDRAQRQQRFKLPANVVGMNEIVLQERAGLAQDSRHLSRLMSEIEAPLTRLLAAGGWSDLRSLRTILSRHSGLVSRANLLNSRAAWDMVLRTYEKSMPEASFLDYFWSWRSLTGGVFSVLLAPIPRARLYHAVSTGYAGLLLSRAVAELRVPGLLTEHGIYTNERRVEIAMAEWLHEEHPTSLAIESSSAGLRDMWISAFVGFSHACYEACASIVTLYRGNQELQKRDGAPPGRLVVIPNGVDFDRFRALARDPAPRPPTVALVGRVVPIKDIKTFIRAAGLLRQRVPNVRAVVLGSAEEDPAYAQECREMVADAGLSGVVEFLGQVDLNEWYKRVDVLVLTSISEAQPLVLLEGGAAGIPAVTTDVGSCREILLGDPDEGPNRKPGGFVTALSNPLATAQACAKLLLDPQLRAAYGSALQERVRRYYDKGTLEHAYRELYDRLIQGRRADALAWGSRGAMAGGR